MTLSILSATLALAACVTLSPACAQDQTGPNLGPGVNGTPGGAKILAMAQDLFAIGMAGKDALTVLAAARLAATVAVTNGPELKKAVTGSAPATEQDSATAPPDAAAMLAAAKALAAEDDVLLDLIEQAEAEGPRERIGGAVAHASALSAGMTDVWDVPLFGGSYAEIAIIGDGDSNLDVTVADENGNSICQDVSGSDKVLCDFVPAWNGYFVVTVQNTGDAKNSYYLMTN